MRLWLLAAWIAQKNATAFSPVNLARWAYEANVGRRFGRRFCRRDPRRQFMQATWKSIWDALPAVGFTNQTIQTLTRYLRDKSAAYDRRGALREAFVGPSRRDELIASRTSAGRYMCPNCGSPVTVPIVYGCQTKKTIGRVKAREVALGGCIMGFDERG